MNLDFGRRRFLERIAWLASVGVLAEMAGAQPAWALAPNQLTLKRRKEVMLDQLSLDDFSPHLGQKFALQSPAGQTLNVELIEAVSLGSKGPRPAHLAAREPFSVTFLAPRDARLTQHIYHLEHEALGSLEIFLVPIGLNEQGLKCEAIFN